MTGPTRAASLTTDALRAGPRLSHEDVRALRRHLIFRCHKLDPQFEDQAAAAPFALYLDRDAWNALAEASEALAAETEALEASLIGRPDLWAALGLPLDLRLALRAARGRRSPAVGRVMRFDWHPTAAGWRVSEVNADVPGGYIEATGLAAWMAARCGGRPPGDPTAALADAVHRGAEPSGPVGLVHATAYTDDRQVMRYLGDALAERGRASRLCSPLDVAWAGGRASLQGEPLAAIVRFFPAEWLSELPLAARWWRWFAPAQTPACNPGAALLGQSKRLPLLWDDLGVDVPVWRASAPRTLPPRAWRADGSLLLKPVWGRVGAGVTLPGVTDRKAQAAAEREARWFARAWVVQERFHSRPVDGPDGPLHVVLGVYTVDGRAAGVYGRCIDRPVVTSHARDVAVLLPQEDT